MATIPDFLQMVKILSKDCSFIQKPRKVTTKRPAPTWTYYSAAIAWTCEPPNTKLPVFSETESACQGKKRDKIISKFIFGIWKMFLKCFNGETKIILKPSHDKNAKQSSSKHYCLFILPAIRSHRFRKEGKNFISLTFASAGFLFFFL